MNENERDLVDRFAYAAWEFIEKFGWCSLWRPGWSLPTACGACTACRMRSLYGSVVALTARD